MWWRLLLLFTLVPAAEIFLLLQIGSAIGPLQTFVLLLVTGVVGAALAKREGLHVLRQLSEEMRRGLPPGVRLVEGGLVVVGGLLLVTPGVLTDVAGVLFIFPPSRRWIAPRALNWFSARLETSEEPQQDGPVRVRQGARFESGGTEPSAHRRPPTHPFANPFDDLP